MNPRSDRIGRDFSQKWALSGGVSARRVSDRSRRHHHNNRPRSQGYWEPGRPWPSLVAQPRQTPRASAARPYARSGRLHGSQARSSHGVPQTTSGNRGTGTRIGPSPPILGLPQPVRDLTANDRSRLPLARRHQPRPSSSQSAPPCGPGCRGAGPGSRSAPSRAPTLEPGPRSPRRAAASP